MEYDDMIGEAIYSKITNAAIPSQILGEDGVMQVTEIENVKDLHIRRKTVAQTIHFEQSDNTLNYETAAFIKMVKTGTGWETARDITLETMKVLDEARRQMGIVFPADKKAAPAETAAPAEEETAPAEVAAPAEEKGNETAPGAAPPAEQKEGE